MPTQQIDGSPIDGPTRGPSRRAETQSLAIILGEEFSAPFAFHDAASGELLDGPPASALCPPEARRLAAARHAQALPREGGGYRIVLPLPESSGPGLLAVGGLRGFARGESEEAQELARLRKWAQSVCDRLHSTSCRPLPHGRPTQTESVGLLGWEAVASVEQLLRRLRINRDRSGQQRRILDSAAELLRMEAVAWVPDAADGEVVLGGCVDLSPHDVRQVAHRLARRPELQRNGWLLLNVTQDSSWAACLPQVANAVVLPVRDSLMSGLLIGLNKRRASEDGRAQEAVRRSDALALTPFAALFGLHGAASLRYQELKDFLVGLTRSPSAAIDAKDAYTYGHSERVGRVAVELGRALNLPEDELSDLYLAGLLHDVGKIGVRDAILCKQGPLTAEEAEHLRQHVTIGHAILSDLHQIRHLLPGVLYHHERYDGTGYPEGLKGDGIPFVARILAVADGYDAMSTTRPYREALPIARVEETLRQGAGSQWDGRVVDAFFRCRERIYPIRQRGIGESLRQAIDGVLRQNGSSQGAEARPE